MCLGCCRGENEIALSSEQRRMIVIQFLQHLFHDGLAEEYCLCADTKFLAVLIDSFHLLVIQIDDLPVAAHQRRLLLLEIFGIDSPGYFLFTGHGGNVR